MEAKSRGSASSTSAHGFPLPSELLLTPQLTPVVSKLSFTHCAFTCCPLN